MARTKKNRNKKKRSSTKETFAFFFILLVKICGGSHPKCGREDFWPSHGPFVKPSCRTLGSKFFIQSVGRQKGG